MVCYDYVYRVTCVVLWMSYYLDHAPQTQDSMTDCGPVAIIEVSSAILNCGSLGKNEPVTTMVVREVACHIVGSNASREWVAQFPRKSSFIHAHRATISAVERRENRLNPFSFEDVSIFLCLSVVESGMSLLSTSLACLCGSSSRTYRTSWTQTVSKGGTYTARAAFRRTGCSEESVSKEKLLAWRNVMSWVTATGLDARTCWSLAALLMQKSFHSVSSAHLKRPIGTQLGLPTTLCLTTVRAQYGQSLPVHASLIVIDTRANWSCDVFNTSWLVC